MGSGQSLEGGQGLSVGEDEEQLSPEEASKLRHRLGAARVRWLAAHFFRFCFVWFLFCGGISDLSYRCGVLTSKRKRPNCWRG